MYSVIPATLLGNWTKFNRPKTNICDDLLFVSPAYILMPISVIGIVLNVFTILVFLKTKTSTIKGDMTRYLIAKSIFDICYNICSVFPFLNFVCFQCEYTLSFWFQVVKLFIVIYLKSVSMFLSIAFNFAATFDRYRYITDSCKFFDKIFAFKRGMPLIICIPVIAYTYRFGLFHIVDMSFLSNSTTWYSIEGIHVSPFVIISINMVQKIIIHFVFITSILVFNFSIVFKLRSTFKHIIQITHSQSHLEAVKKSEVRNTFMLIWTSPVIIIPNYLFFIISILEMISIIEFYNPCAESIGDIVFSLQFAVPFIFYYSFNVNFRKAFHQLMGKKVLEHQEVNTNIPNPIKSITYTRTDSMYLDKN